MAAVGGGEDKLSGRESSLDEAAECTVMQESQDFEAYAAGASITGQGAALVTLLTDKGHIAVLMRRVVLERLSEQAKSELQRVPRTGQKR